MYCAPTIEAPKPAPVVPNDIPTVMVVSDVVLYREGLAASIERDRRLRPLGLVCADDALPAIAANRPHVVLIDGGMPSCLDLARKIRAHIDDVRIVGFGISGGADRLVDCAEAGLAAFVDSSGSLDELVAAVLSAIDGRLACSPEVSALMCERLARLSTGRSRQSDALTRREQEIAALIGRGLSNKEIANDLRIGVSTVKNHVHSILEKLDVRRRSAIVRQLREFHWMEGVAA
jgi:two-component system, NarL family, nitrate/nitrite response regulator NarL